MGINVNFADVEESDFSPLPRGTYNAVIFECEQTETQNEGKNPAGTPMLKWTFQITDEEYKNRRAWMNTVLAGGGIGMLKALLKATGQFTDEELNADDFDLDPDDVIGAPVGLVITQGTNPNTGEKNHSVKRVVPADASASELP